MQSKLSARFTLPIKTNTNASNISPGSALAMGKHQRFNSSLGIACTTFDKSARCGSTIRRFNDLDKITYLEPDCGAYRDQASQLLYKDYLDEFKNVKRTRMEKRSSIASTNDRSDKMRDVNLPELAMTSVFQTKSRTRMKGSHRTSIFGK